MQFGTDILCEDLELKARISRTHFEETFHDSGIVSGGAASRTHDGFILEILFVNMGRQWILDPLLV